MFYGPGKYSSSTNRKRESKVIFSSFPSTHPVHDLWRVIAGEVVGRDNDEQITIFDSVGFALEDFSALTYVHRVATELNEGIEIELVPTLDDPKNLFERVLDGSGRAQTRKAA